MHHDEAIDVMSSALRRRDAERLAIEAIEAQHLPAAQASGASVLPLAELAKAGAEDAWRTPSCGPRSSERDHGVEREL